MNHSVNEVMYKSSHFPSMSSNESLGEFSDSGMSIEEELDESFANLPEYSSEEREAFRKAATKYQQQPEPFIFFSLKECVSCLKKKNKMRCVHLLFSGKDKFIVFWKGQQCNSHKPS